MQTMIVKPIVQGYVHSQALQFTNADGTPPATMTPLTSAAAIAAQVRAAPGAENPLLATATVTVTGDYALTISLAAADTANFPVAGVYIDFARRDGTIWTPLPVLIRWPVRKPVTIVP